MEENDVLKPWYEKRKTVEYCHQGGVRHLDVEDGLEKLEQQRRAFIAKPVLKKHPLEVKDRKVPDFGWAVTSFPNWAYAELTVAVRRALRGDAPFQLSNADGMALLQPWYEERKSRGLKDIAMIFGYKLHDAEVWMGNNTCAVFCWYEQGEVSRLTLRRDNDDLKYDEHFFANAHLQKPLFEDNISLFREALCDMASVAGTEPPGKGWHDLFMDAFGVLNDYQRQYHSQEFPYFVPAPYYRYMVAVSKTWLGGGMGSWQELQMDAGEVCRLATHQLEYEKCQAVLYAVNNC